MLILGSNFPKRINIYAIIELRAFSPWVIVVGAQLKEVAQSFKLGSILDNGGEVHWSVKNFNPRQGYLRQRLVWRTRWKNKKNKKTLKLEFSGGQVSCLRV